MKKVALCVCGLFASAIVACLDTKAVKDFTQEAKDYLGEASYLSAPSPNLRGDLRKFLSRAETYLADSCATLEDKKEVLLTKLEIASFFAEFYRGGLKELSFTLNQMRPIFPDDSEEIGIAKAIEIFHYYRWNRIFSVDRYLTEVSILAQKFPRGFDGPFYIARFAHFLAQSGAKFKAIDVLKNALNYFPEQSSKKLLTGALTQVNLVATVPNIVGPRLDGSSFSIDSLRGKVVILDFWASWCGPCRQFTPELKKIYNKYKKYGIEIVGVSLDKSENALRQYVNDNKVDWEIVFSPETKVVTELAKNLGVTYIPSIFLIDSNGVIVSSGQQLFHLDASLRSLLSRSALRSFE